jgi:hypothetical protein
MKKTLVAVGLSFSLLLTPVYAAAAQKQLTLAWDQAEDDLPDKGGNLEKWTLYSTTDNVLPFDQWKKEGEVPYTVPGTPGTGTQTFQGDFDILAPDNSETSFWFKMTATDTTGNESAPSDAQASAPTVIDFKAPVAPVAAGTYNSQTKVVTITWTQDPADTDITSHRVYKSLTSGGPYEDLGVQTSPFDYPVASSDSGKWLYFVVDAHDDDENHSAKSVEVAVKLTMGVPFNLKVTVSTE